jgi:hypothetical protein
MQGNLFDESTPPLAGKGSANNSYTQQHTRSSPNLYPPSHHNAPRGTSEVAAALIAANTPSQRALIYRAILKSGAHGLTDDEGMVQLGIIAQSYPARRGELAKLGVIRDTGDRRKTRTGHNAAVWATESKRGDGGDE